MFFVIFVFLLHKHSFKEFIYINKKYISYQWLEEMNMRTGRALILVLFRGRHVSKTEPAQHFCRLKIWIFARNTPGDCSGTAGSPAMFRSQPTFARHQNLFPNLAIFQWWILTFHSSLTGLPCRLLRQTFNQYSCSNPKILDFFLLWNLDESLRSAELCGYYQLPTILEWSPSISRQTCTK